MEKIGFTGLGIMGKSMARNLMKAGYEVHGYARHPEKVQDLKKEGMILHDTLADAARNSDIFITMVGYPSDVEEVYFKDDGILQNMKPDSLVIDMTTSDPELAKKIEKAAAERSIAAMDAPVTGGDAGARNGTLTILAGGSPAAFQRALPLFEAMGSNICYQGGAGNGQSAKLVNQILISGAMAGLAEAWAYADALGLDPHVLYESLHTGAAGSKSLDLYWPRLEKGDLQPGFFIKHFIKDMKLARKQAENHNLELPVLDLILQEYTDLHEDSLGTQALIDFYLQKEKNS